MLVDDLRDALKGWSKDEGDKHKVLTLVEARPALEALTALHPILPGTYDAFFIPTTDDGAVVVRYDGSRPIFAAWFERHNPGEVDWRFLVGTAEGYDTWCSGMAAEHLKIKRGFFRRLLYDAGIKRIVGHFPRAIEYDEPVKAAYRANLLASARALGYVIEEDTGIGLLVMEERP